MYFHEFTIAGNTISTKENINNFIKNRLHRGKLN